MKSVLLLLCFWVGFYFVLDSTLEGMTRHDCEVNKIQEACQSLNK